MNIKDLPIEDLAHGVFPKGAEEEVSINAIGRNRHQSNVVSAIRSFRKSAYNIVAVDLRIVDYSTTIGIDSEYGRTSASWTAAPLSKQFKIRLPKWLAPIDLKDAIAIENSLYWSMFLLIREWDASFGYTEMQVGTNRHDNYDTSLIKLKVNP